MDGRGSRRIVLPVVLLFVLCAAAAGLARWRLSRAHPFAPAGWWRPREVPPAVDPELLARASRERRALAEELAERRARLRPVPERLRGATAVGQIGHAGRVTALAWRGADLWTTGEDGTLRVWRFDGRRLREGRAVALPGPAEAVAAAPDGERVWVFVAPGRLVTREGPDLEVERVRAAPSGHALGLAPADEGRRVVLLLERRGADGSRSLAVCHYLEPETVRLKEVALEVVAPLAAALSPDGERVAVLARGDAGPVVELRRSADGALLGTVPLPAPARDAEAPGPPATATLGFGSDFLAVADAGGLRVVPLEADGAPGAAVLFPGEADAAGGRAVLGACDSAVVVGGAGAASVVRRTPEGWRSEAAGAEASRAACTAGGTVTALAHGERLEVRSPSGPAASISAARLSAVALVGEGAFVETVWTGEAGRAGRTRFDLERFAASSAEAPGELLAMDASSGEALWSAADGVRFETGTESKGWTAAEGTRPVAMRGGRIASLAEAGDRVVLQDREGSVLGSWSPPEWLGGNVRLTPCVDGRTVVATGTGGFAAWRAGRADVLVEFPGEGYEGAPAETSPDGRLVLVGREDGTVEGWGVESWDVERSFFAIGAQGGRPTVLRWSADGEVLYVGGSRGGVVALQGRTGNPLWGAAAHEGPVTVVEPDRSGSWVLTADGRTAALTAARGGERLVRFVVGDDGSWAAFTEDGYHAAGGPEGQRLLALRLSPEEGAKAAGRVGPMVGAEDEAFGRLGGATDALRATLLGAAAPAEEP